MHPKFSYFIMIYLVLLGIVGTVYIVIIPLKAPLVYSVQPFSLDKKAYETHETMTITSYRCNYEGVPLVVTTKERYFINTKTGKRFDLPDGMGVVQEGCSWQFATVKDGFHPDMPSGEYVKRGVSVAQGRFRTIEVPWITQNFQYTKVD